MRLAKLPSANNYRKFAPVPAKSGTGISLLKNHRAQRRSSEALFLCLLVMAGHSGALRSAGSLWPVRLTLFGLPPNRLASTVAVLNNTEDTIMESPTQDPSGSTDTEALYEAIRDVNSLAQEGFLQVAALASLVALRLESGIQYAWQLEELRYALQVIRSRSLDARSCILCIAQDSGCFDDAEVGR